MPQRASGGPGPCTSELVVVDSRFRAGLSGEIRIAIPRRVCLRVLPPKAPCPDLFRASTSSHSDNFLRKGVGGRVEPGHGDPFLVARDRRLATVSDFPGQPCASAGLMTEAGGT